MVKGLETKTPVESSHPINKYESIFKTTHCHAISKCDLNVHHIKIFGGGSVDWFATLGFWNGAVGPKGYREFASVDILTIPGNIDQVLVFLKMVAAGHAMEFLCGPV
jgi:hypothetical protein